MQRKIRIKYFGEGRSLVSYIHMCVHMYQVKIILLMNFSDCDCDCGGGGGEEEEEEKEDEGCVVDIFDSVLDDI